MASINIDRRIDDPFGRYQMPRLSIQNQGGKTILVNIFDVGKALHRSPLCMSIKRKEFDSLMNIILFIRHYEIL